MLHITQGVTHHTVIWSDYPTSQRRQNILFEQRNYFATELTQTGPCPNVMSSYHSRYRITIIKIVRSWDGFVFMMWIRVYIQTPSYVFIVHICLLLWLIVVVLVLWLLIFFFVNLAVARLLIWFKICPGLSVLINQHRYLLGYLQMMTKSHSVYLRGSHLGDYGNLKSERLGITTFMIPWNNVVRFFYRI